jgi:GT2 family glycosyltransferase
MWKTAVARDVGFYEGFKGYAQGEDLEFSLRARAYGKMYISGAARVTHLYETNGRPDSFRRGHMAVYNRYHIYCRALPDRSWRDIAWFAYALAIDTLLLGRYIIVPAEWWAILLQITGRLKAIYDIMRTRLKRARNRHTTRKAGGKRRITG